MTLHINQYISVYDCITDVGGS